MSGCVQITWKKIGFLQKENEPRPACKTSKRLDDKAFQ